MISAKPLLAALQKRVLLLEDDLRARCNAQPEVDAPLRKDYEAAREKGRTGLTYNAWRDEELTQIAVAWILAGVFVRFLEDNELIDVPFLAGGNAARHQRAQDEHSLFFRQHPTASERDHCEHVFNTVGKLPGMKDFFDRRHIPLWRVGPTADAAKALLEFWRKTDPDTGRILHDFRSDADQSTHLTPALSPLPGRRGRRGGERAAVISAKSKTVRRGSLSGPSGEGLNCWELVSAEFMLHVGTIQPIVGDRRRFPYRSRSGLRTANHRANLQRC